LTKQKLKDEFNLAMVPKSDEWDTSKLPDSRRAYLDHGLSFEDITAATLSEAQVRKNWIRPYEDAPEGYENYRQVCFRVRIGHKNCDLIYNAPDGLRGRYWQSPDKGFLATRLLIDALKPKLLEFTKVNPLSADIDEVCASLDAPSAKVWVRENISYAGPKLRIRRWEANEIILGSKGRLWRWTAYEDEIDVKGALLGPAGNEAIPDGKRDRSCQIHHNGFT
jgi:hypothetical protein